MKGSQGLILVFDNNNPIITVSPALEELHFFDSDMEGEAVSSVLSGIKKEEEYEERICGMWFSG